MEASAQGMTTDDPPGELGRQIVRLSDVGACPCQAAGRPGITSPNCNVKRYLLTGLLSLSLSGSYPTQVGPLDIQGLVSTSFCFYFLQRHLEALSLGRRLSSLRHILLSLVLLAPKLQSWPLWLQQTRTSACSPGTHCAGEPGPCTRKCDPVL